jgi:Na+/H+ antiporter NhaC
LAETFPLGWLCVLPPLLTISLAIATQRVVVSLLLGIMLAVGLMLTHPAATPAPAALDSQTTLQASPSQGDSAVGTASLASNEEPVARSSSNWLVRFVYSLCEEHLWKSLFNESHLRVFAFTSLLGMQVALIHRAGGMQGIVAWTMPFARSRRGGQVLTWFLGLVIFIDDYANTLLLGSTMRPLTDRLKISREKLAYLVDSTAAPVSGLALVSTWVATEISSMQVGYSDAGIDIGSDTFGIFIQTIPGRFYILYTLLFVLLCALLCRDFGPMLTAERRAQREPNEDEPDTGDSTQAAAPPRALNAILPISITVAVVVWLLIVTGQQKLGTGESLPTNIQDWGKLIGQGDSYVSLLYGALSGLISILLLIRMQQCVSLDNIRAGLVEGFLHVFPAMVILWLAWTLSHLTGNEHLRTGAYIAAQLTELDIAVGWMPTIVFLLSSGIAFATGTSWGTMAILMPIIIPLVYGLLQSQLGITPPVDHYVLVASIGSVLAGAIFGDHCSPISDTTILSSRSSSCDHIAHVRTQMPYALTVGAVSIVCGTLPAGFGVSNWLLLPIGTVAMVAILLLVGKKAEQGGELN